MFLHRGSSVYVMRLRLSKCEPPLSRNTLRNSDTFFFRAGLCVSLAGEAAVSSLHCGEVNETRRVVGETRRWGGGPQVYSLSVTCTPRNLGNIPIASINPLTTLLY